MIRRPAILPNLSDAPVESSSAHLPLNNVDDVTPSFVYIYSSCPTRLTVPHHWIALQDNGALGVVPIWNNMPIQGREALKRIVPKYVDKCSLRSAAHRVTITRDHLSNILWQERKTSGIFTRC
jgi:hypothetical protein